MDKLHLSSIGLVLKIIGVSILYFVVIETGEQVYLIGEQEEKERLEKIGKMKTFLKIGYI